MHSGTAVYQQEAAKARRDELILGHLPLVRHAIGRLVGRLPASVDVENLESAGILGLVEAAARFDPERGVRFETFAFPRIRGAVVDELRRNTFLPQKMLENIAAVRRQYQRLEAPVTVAALAAATALSEEEVTECLAAMRLTRTVSLDELGSRAGAEPLQDDAQPEFHAVQGESLRLLTEAITALPEKKRLVVTLYYLEDLRLKEIAEIVHLSESRVSRILDAALFELGEHLRARGVGPH